MKKIEIIEIQKISQAIPKKKTWYKYFDEIFVSVICLEGRKSHIRNKNQRDYNFIDNKMCYWHCHWQYDLIENFYGNREKDIKTFEKIIFHNEEKHIIDSVVNDIGIEFQHTLSVSIEEMDSRWDAQKNNGFNPYLVLDFIEYSIPNFLFLENNYNYNSFKKLLENNEDETSIKILRKILKWSKSKYFINDNLFIEFADGIVRFNKNLLVGNIIYSKTEFVESLLFLEEQLKNRIMLDDIERKKREKKRKKIEKIQEEENLRISRKKLRIIYEQEEKERLKEIEKLKHNNFDKEKNIDFQYFRIILNEKKINKHFEKINFSDSIFEFSTQTDKIDNSIIKNYFYYSKVEKLLMIYSNVGIVQKDEYNFLSSEIKILKKADNEVIRSFTYKKNKGEKLKIVEYKSEIALGYLHSLSDFSLVKYDENEVPFIKEHYIFNKKVQSHFFKDLSTSVDIGFEYLIQVEKKKEDNLVEIKSLLKDIYSQKDIFKFIEDISSGYGINSYRLKEYYEYQNVEFKDYLLKSFFILDY